MDIVNPAKHEHRGNPCMDCGEAWIVPILTQEDFEARQVARIQEQDDKRWSNFKAGCVGLPLDMLLMDLCNELAIDDGPDYIAKVGAAYTDMPPHTRFGATAEWWND